MKLVANRPFLLTASLGLLMLHATTLKAQVWADVDGGTTKGGVFTVYSDGLDNLLYVGGIFDTVGPDYYASRGFATFDGTNWNDLTGTFGDDVTNCIARYNGNIYHGVSMGGLFKGIQAEENRVGNFNDKVLALAVYNGELYAGGTFTAVGQPDTLMNRIAKYDGAHWTPVGEGIKSSNASSDVGVYALYVYNGELYAGGIFDTAGSAPSKNIAKWNGSQWSAVGSGVNITATDSGKVAAFTSYNGDLIVGGLFNSAGGTAASNISEWNGTSWSSFPGTFNSEIYALCVYNTHLFAGGTFKFNGDQKNHIAEWKGSTWSSLGGGMTNGSGVRSLTVWNGMLIVGGNFNQLEDTLTVSNLASWTEPLKGHHYLPPDDDDFVATPSVISGPSVIHIIGKSVIRKIEVIDKCGRCCEMKEFAGNDSNVQIELNSQLCNPGIYLIRIHTAIGVINKKIVIL